ncbi:MAG: response regulator, partial [Hyphomicrobium sp.]
MSASHAAHLTKTVLIADDDPVYREVGREALAHRRYGVSVAADGGQALKALAEHKFNLAIIDLTMPVADGITVIARTRAQGP